MVVTLILAELRQYVNLFPPSSGNNFHFPDHAKILLKSYKLFQSLPFRNTEKESGQTGLSLQRALLRQDIQHGNSIVVPQVKGAASGEAGKLFKGIIEVCRADVLRVDGGRTVSLNGFGTAGGAVLARA